MLLSRRGAQTSATTAVLTLLLLSSVVVLASPRTAASEQDPATAASCTYTVHADGNWSDPGTWSPAPVSPFPGTVSEGCRVIVPAGMSVKVTSNLNNLGSIEITGSLIVTPGAILDQGGTIVNQGTLRNDGGYIDQTGGAIVNDGGTVDSYVGGLSIDGGNFTNTSSGEVVIEPPGLTSSTFNSWVWLGGGTLFNNGNISNNGLIQTEKNGSILNQGDGAIWNSFAINNEGNLTNQAGGTIDNENGASIDNTGTMINSGMIMNPGTIHSPSPITGKGSIGNSTVITRPFGIPLATVSCTPPSIVANSTTVCVGKVTDTLSSVAGETVNFNSSSPAGAFLPTRCVLVSDSCSLYYGTPQPGTSIITISFPGDPDNGPTVGWFELSVVRQTNSTTTSTSRTTTSATTGTTMLTSSTPTVASVGVSVLPVQPLLFGLILIIAVFVAYRLTHRDGRNPVRPKAAA